MHLGLTLLLARVYAEQGVTHRSLGRFFGYARPE